VVSIPQDDEAGDARQATKLMPLWVVGWIAPDLAEALEPLKRWSSARTDEVPRRDARACHLAVPRPGARGVDQQREHRVPSGSGERLGIDVDTLRNWVQQGTAVTPL
jgi:hypothetical protein